MIRRHLQCVCLLLLSGFSAVVASKPLLLVGSQGTTSIVIDKSDATVVQRAAAMLSADIQRVSGRQPAVVHQLPDDHLPTIIAGTLGQSALIDELVSQGSIDPAALRNAWERYQIFVLTESKQPKLVVVGSDRRGTAYGLLSLSRKIGVSPWQWWADVNPAKQFPLVVDISPYLSESPSVKYRGVFINDEDWGIQVWAAKHYEPETGDMGPKTYARVFELLLRLRANTLWPAMHSTTTPFYQIPANKQVADDYAIVIGTSHAEPMLSNINGEWDQATMGDYRFDTNAEAVTQFFRQRINETADYEGIYTVAMRGKHDSPMIMQKSTMAEQVQLLEDVISTQRALLEEGFGQPASAVPQVFVPYKEVLTYYQNGLEVPDDITLMWTDDNYGYLRQLSNPQEQQRAGGAGIYYHTSYWGRPHDYLWLNSTNPVLMWQEITKAWDLNARQQWILNVGDIKPHEYNMELFLDIAWQRGDFAKPDSVYQAISGYLQRDLSAKLAQKLAPVFKQYYHLVYQRRPEFMAWNHVEPVTLAGDTELTQTHYGDEVSEWIEQWESLIEQVETVKLAVPAAQQAAFYQLAYYPVVMAGSVSLKWLYYYKNRFAAAQGRGDAAWYAQQMQNNFHRIQQQTDYYNNGLAEGKWQHMMSASPRELPVFDLPPASAPMAQNAGVSLILEGFDVPLNGRITNSHAATLPVFNAFSREPRFIDIVLNEGERKNWQLKAVQPWITFSTTNGTLTKENPHQRVWVSIDWDAVPKGKADKEPPLGHDHQLIPPSYKVAGEFTLTSGLQTHTVHLNVFNPHLPELKDFKGYVESLGYVAIEVADYQDSHSTKNAKWIPIDNLGHSNRVMQVQPIIADSVTTLPTIRQQAPWLAYDFYTFNHGSAEVTVNVVPSHAVYAGKGVRVAVAIDQGPLQIIDFKTAGRSEKWKQNVLSNLASATVKIPVKNSGEHRLTLYMVDAGVMVDQILIDLGGKKASYLLPPATKNQAVN